MKAACEENPDLWFTTLPAGQMTQTNRKQLKNGIKSAIDACFECPAMIACGDLGMLPENLYHGIWGGMLPSERLAKAGKMKDDYHPQHIGHKAFLLEEFVYATV